MEDSFGWGGDNSSDNQLDYNESTVDAAFKYLIPIFLFLFFIIGLPLNVLVIGIIFKKKLFTRPSVMLMLNLAICNFLSCLLAMPFPLVASILAKNNSIKENIVADDFTIFNKLCDASFLYVLFQSVSILTVAMMSLDRVIYLKKPLTYEGIVTPWRMLTAILVVWIVSIGISLPPLFGVRRYHYNQMLDTCSSSGGHVPYYVLLISLIALGTLIQLFGCGCIIYITRKHLLRNLRRSLGNNTQTQNDCETQNYILRNHKKSQLQLVKVFGAIVTVSLLTALPTIVSGVIGPFASPGTTLTAYDIIASIINFSRPVLHPIMESYMTHEIRSVISKSCQSCFARIRSHRLCQRGDVIAISPGRAEVVAVDIPATN